MNPTFTKPEKGEKWAPLIDSIPALFYLAPSN